MSEMSILFMVAESGSEFCIPCWCSGHSSFSAVLGPRERCRTVPAVRPTISILGICIRQVQRGCIPAILAGRDVIGTAHTGSGKTAAFALPILQVRAPGILSVRRGGRTDRQALSSSTSTCSRCGVVANDASLTGGLSTPAFYCRAQIPTAGAAVSCLLRSDVDSHSSSLTTFLESESRVWGVE
jgi:DEAD/DEAH box helicase